MSEPIRSILTFQPAVTNENQTLKTSVYPSSARQAPDGGAVAWSRQSKAPCRYRTWPTVLSLTRGCDNAGGSAGTARYLLQQQVVRPVLHYHVIRTRSNVKTISTHTSPHVTDQDVDVDEHNEAGDDNASSEVSYGENPRVRNFLLPSPTPTPLLTASGTSRMSSRMSFRPASISRGNPPSATLSRPPPSLAYIFRGLASSTFRSRTVMSSLSRPPLPKLHSAKERGPLWTQLVWLYFECVSDRCLSTTLLRQIFYEESPRRLLTDLVSLPACPCLGQNCINYFYTSPVLSRSTPASRTLLL